MPFHAGALGIIETNHERRIIGCGKCSDPEISLVSRKRD
jgi:hypothetical protein